MTGDNKNELKAIRVVRSLFKDVAGDEIARTDLKITDKTFYNYSPLIQKYGLVEMVEDNGTGKKILAIRLTDKGKMVVANQQTPASAETAVIDPLTNLDALGDFIAKFNSRNKYWEIKLTPKEEPIEQR